jgi:DNA modification methylase
VGHFLPQISGRVLEPCEGGGAFTRAFAYHGIQNVTALEISRGSDFFEFHEHVAWTITNPPWGKARKFLKHAYEVSDNVVFLIPLCHVLSLRARIADMYEAGFSIKEILLCPTPGPPWAPSGFQLGAVHFQRGYRGQIAWGWLDDQEAGTETIGQESAAPIVHPPRVVRGSAFAIPLADKTVQTVISSPPYFRLRQYPGGKEGDFGREATVREYVDHTVEAMREVRRVLRDDGLVFWNIGDCYHGGGRGANKKINPFCDTTPFRGQGKAKSLCLIPQHVEIALADDGWIVRSVVIWEKGNPAPESVGDRPTASYEHVIILAKSDKYFWNKEEARELSLTSPHAVGSGRKGDALISDGTHGERAPKWDMRHSNKVGSSKTEKRLMPPIGGVKQQRLRKGTLVGNTAPSDRKRNIRDVWHINTAPHKEKHIAMFPEELVKKCILFGSKPGDLVFDPCAGSGCTGLVAHQLGRNSVVMDISAEYCQLMKTRLSQEAGGEAWTEEAERRSAFHPAAPDKEEL